MERFGRYVLLERIAEGGMAEVFRAAAIGSAGFSKLLAVKRILPHLVKQEAFVTMLIDEAKIASTLNHPNILQVLDLGDADGQYFVAMEFIAGRTLTQLITAGHRKKVRLPIPICLHAVAQALDGLAYAHAKVDADGQPMHIIHRDVSPQNIMVSYDGSVRLMDFGIAKAALRTTTETAVGNIKGKPSYLAPEQVRGDPIDQRVDIYAMGVVLHELLAMRRMRRGQDDMNVLMEVFQGTYARFDELGVLVPPEVAAAVYKALEPDPQARFQTAAEMARVLYELLRNYPTSVGPQPVSALMSTLFPDEIAAEREAQQRFAEVMRQLSHASNTEVGIILQRESAHETHPTSPADATIVERPSRKPQKTRPVIPIVVGAALAAGLAIFGLSRPSHGRLTITTDPPGAFVKVGGVAKGTAPVTVDSVPPGSVEVEAVMEGMAPAHEMASVQADETTAVNVRLVPKEVLLPISTNPPAADVKLDGKPAGTTPTTIRLQGAAPVRLTIELAGHVPVDQMLVPASAPPLLTFELEKVALPQPAPDDKRPVRRPAEGEEKVDTSGAPAVLALQSKPWAKIFVDGSDTGRFTPVVNLEVKPGKHTIKLVNEENGLQSEFTVILKPGETQKLFKELK